MKSLSIVLCLFISIASNAQIEKQKGLLTKVPKSTKKLDIPKYPNSKETPYIFWHFCKQKEQQLNLSSLEIDTIQNLTYRVWITNPVGRKNQPTGLIEIKKLGQVWQGELMLMKVDLNKKKLTETITESKRITLVPKISDWENILDSLILYKFSQLPTDNDIPSYYETKAAYGNNSPTFSFEYSTPTVYRFYQYNNIYRAIDKFWQPKNVDAILDILEREFAWDSFARAYFNIK